MNSDFWVVSPRAPRAVSAESGWSSGPGPPSPAQPPSQPSSPSARPRRDGTDGPPSQTADSGGHKQTVSLSSSLLSITSLFFTDLFSGPDAAVQVVPQPAEGLVPPQGLPVLLQSSAQLLH